MDDEAAKALADFDATLSSLTRAANAGPSAESKLIARDAHLIAEMQAFLDQLAQKASAALAKSWSVKLKDNRADPTSQTSKLRIIVFRQAVPHVVADCTIYAGFFQIFCSSPQYAEGSKREPEDQIKGLSAFMATALAKG